MPGTTASSSLTRPAGVRRRRPERPDAGGRPPRRGRPRHPVSPLPDQAGAGHRGTRGTDAAHATPSWTRGSPIPTRGTASACHREICALHARNRGFTAAFMSAFPMPWISPRTASTPCARLTPCPPAPGRRPPAPRLRPGRPDPHSHGQRRHPRDLTGRRGHGVQALRRARDPGFPGITAGVSAATGSPPDTGCADFLRRCRRLGGWFWPPRAADRGAYLASSAARAGSGRLLPPGDDATKPRPRISAKLVAAAQPPAAAAVTGTARARRRRSMRASAKPTARAAASTVAPWPIRCSARSSRSSCW